MVRITFGDSPDPVYYGPPPRYYYRPTKQLTFKQFIVLVIIFLIIGLSMLAFQMFKEYMKHKRESDNKTVPTKTESEPEPDPVPEGFWKS